MNPNTQVILTVYQLEQKYVSRVSYDALRAELAQAREALQLVDDYKNRTNQYFDKRYPELRGLSSQDLMQHVWGKIRAAGARAKKGKRNELQR